MRVRGYIWALFDVTFKVPCSRALLIALRRTGSLLILRMSLITTDSLKLRGIYDPARQLGEIHFSTDFAKVSRE